MQVMQICFLPQIMLLHFYIFTARRDVKASLWHISAASTTTLCFGVTVK